MDRKRTLRSLAARRDGGGGCGGVSGGDDGGGGSSSNDDDDRQAADALEPNFGSMFVQEPMPVDGYVTLPANKPGWGLEFNKAALNLIRPFPHGAVPRPLGTCTPGPGTPTPERRTPAAPMPASKL